MKIDFVTGSIDNSSNYGAGGVAYVLSTVSAGLISHGYIVKIVNMFKGDSPSTFRFNECDLKYLQCKHKHDPSFVFLKKTKFWFFVFPKLVSYFLKSDADTYVSVSPPITCMLLLLNLFLKKRVIVWENVSFKKYGALITLFRSFLYRTAYLVVSVSKDDLCFLQKNKIPCKLIHNPISILGSVPFRSLTSPIIFLAAGRLVEQKGFDILVNVASKLKETGLNFKVNIIGSGQDRDKLSALISKLELKEHVYLIPFQESLTKYYIESTIFLMSSRYEGLPVVLLESQAYGLPCVSFDCPTGPAEVIESGKNGLLVDCFDIDQYVKKIFEIISDDSIYKEMSMYSIEMAKKFDINNILIEWRQSLEKGVN